MVTDDAHMIALNRLSGSLLWDTEMADYQQHYGGTSRSAGGEGSGALRDLGRRRGRARFRGCVPCRDRRARVALLDDARAGRAGLGDVGRPGDRARMRDRVADRNLRSGDRADLLADWQSLSGLQRRRAQGRQSLFELGRRARAEDGQAALVLPIHSARSARLGRRPDAHARRRRVPWPRRAN